MAEEKSTYLSLCLHGERDASLNIEFLPAHSDRDGIWVRTTLPMTKFRSEFMWFLATSSQQELATLACELTHASGDFHCALHDTDCSFSMNFWRKGSPKNVDVALEFHHYWGDPDPAIVLHLKHATASSEDVQRLLLKLSEFS